MTEKMITLRESRENVIQAIGWTHAEMCIALDKDEDPREIEMPEILERAKFDLKLEGI